MTRMYALIPTLLAASLAPACGDTAIDYQIMTSLYRKHHQHAQNGGWS